MSEMNKLIKEIFILILVSSLLGISAQAVLPNGIGMITEVTLVGDDATAVAIPSVSINPNGEENAAANIDLQAAHSAYEAGSAIFLDARSPEDFAAGHIKEAINLPVHAFLDSLTYLETINSATHIITYCDGEDCNASIDLAADLKMMGFSKVNFFFGGWQEWQTAGYPVEGDS